MKAVGSQTLIAENVEVEAGSWGTLPLTPFAQEEGGSQMDLTQKVKMAQIPYNVAVHCSYLAIALASLENLISVLQQESNGDFGSSSRTQQKKALDHHFQFEILEDSVKSIIHKSERLGEKCTDQEFLTQCAKLCHLFEKTQELGWDIVRSMGMNRVKENHPACQNFVDLLTLTSQTFTRKDLAYDRILDFYNSSTL